MHITSAFREVYFGPWLGLWAVRSAEKLLEKFDSNAIGFFEACVKKGYLATSTHEFLDEILLCCPPQGRIKGALRLIHSLPCDPTGFCSVREILSLANHRIKEFVLDLLNKPEVENDVGIETFCHNVCAQALQGTGKNLGIVCFSDLFDRAQKNPKAELALKIIREKEAERISWTLRRKIYEFCVTELERRKRQYLGLEPIDVSVNEQILELEHNEHQTSD